MGTPPSCSNAWTWPSRNDSWHCEANARCTALPEYDIRSVNKNTLVFTPATTTYKSAKSTSACAPGSWVWAI
jgi:hypothetical protein